MKEGGGGRVGEKASETKKTEIKIGDIPAQELCSVLPGRPYLSEKKTRKGRVDLSRILHLPLKTQPMKISLL